MDLLIAFTILTPRVLFGSFTNNPSTVVLRIYPNACVCVWVVVCVCIKYYLGMYICACECTLSVYIYTHKSRPINHTTVQANQGVLLFQDPWRNRFHSTRPHNLNRTWTPNLHQKNHRLWAQITHTYKLSIWASKIYKYCLYKKGANLARNCLRQNI
jgi:hypothetical protein